jgi:nucleotide-binding universal stress UspA family protein
MLRKAAVKVGLSEPRAKFLEMINFLKYFGTQSIQLIHVMTGTAQARHDHVRGQMDALAAEVKALGFEVEAVIKHGHAATQIIDSAHELDVDYICIYWMPKNAFSQAIMGSIDLDILRMSDVPIFVHNRSLLGGAPTEFGSVLYATNFKATDALVMPYLKNKDFRAEKLAILHVGDRAPDPYAEQKRRDKVQTALDRLASECRESFTEIETLDIVGSSRKVILKMANTFDVDVIVLGKSDNPDALENLLGSTAETVARKANRSVFIVTGSD